MRVTRRALLRWGLASGAMAAAGCRPRLPTLLTQALGAAGTGKRPVGPVVWKKSVCLQCPAGCGIQVKTIAGNAVKIEGNPDHPLNRGRLCPKGQAGLQVLHDPDRIRGPMKRSGRRGSGEWRRISWAQAVKEVAGRLGQVRRELGPQSLVVMSGRARGRMKPLLHRFARTYGTPNEIDAGDIGSGNARLAHFLTQGIDDYLAFDWENANHVISFGAGLIESFRPTVMVQRMVAHLRRGRPGIRAKIVTVDPRLSVTASKSDEWIPIRPGTDGALALGMACVIVRENLHDLRFLGAHSLGFGAWKRTVLDSFSVEDAAHETGLPAEEIERLARDMASRRPSIAVAGRGAGMHTNGLYNLMAIHCLNALVGSIGTRGGAMVQDDPVFAEWPEVEPEETARKGLSMPRLDRAGTSAFPLAASVSSALPDAILRDRPYKTGAILLYYTNPLFSTPDPDSFLHAFEKVDTVVSFSPFLDESAAMADYVLPDHTYLERWQDDVPPPSVGYPVLGLRQPVVEPLHDTKDTGDVLIEIARCMGGDVAAAFPWKDHYEAIRSAIEGTAAAAGMGAGEFWKRLAAQGVWSRGPYEWDDPSRAFRTPSKKFEFVSSLMKKRLDAVAAAEGMNVDDLASRLGIEARGETVFMPHYEPPKTGGGDGAFSLYLNAYKTMMHAEGRGANQPWLQESFGVQLGESWGPWIEVHPQTARGCGIQEGSPVRIESALGWISAKARLFEGVVPGVVNIPYEYGHVGAGRWIVGPRANPNAVTEVLYDRLSGVVSRSSTKVRICKTEAT